jgi:hypothetical protein
VIELFFKIILPVLLIGAVTLAAHRWGPAVAGILSAVPAKGGPILIFLALDQGTSFASTSAAASLGGAAGCGVFCLAYALVCRRLVWPLAGLVAYLAFLAVWAVMLPISSFGLGPAFVATVAILLVSRRLLPAAPPTGHRKMAATDLPIRMFAGAAMVVFVTTVGPYFGATISGMLTTIPTIAAVMAMSTHAQEGADRAVGVMRGLTHGLLGFAAFLTVLGATLVPLGVPGAFALAATTVVIVQAIELRAAFRTHGRTQNVSAEAAADPAVILEAAD